MLAVGKNKVSFEWDSKTELVDSVIASSRKAMHDKRTVDKERIASFRAALAARGMEGCAPSPAALLDRAQQRDHLLKTLSENSYIALPSLDETGAVSQDQWSVLQVLSLRPGDRMYIQRLCFLGKDVPGLWLRSRSKASCHVI